MNDLIQELHGLERVFAQRAGKIDKRDAYDIISQQDVSDETLQIALDIVDVEFHPNHAFIPQTYLRTEGIAGRFRVALMTAQKVIAPKPFQGRGTLTDYDLNVEFLRSIDVNPLSHDDTQFLTETVYCSAHMRKHATGWCTVLNALKLPVDETLPVEYQD